MPTMPPEPQLTIISPPTHVRDYRKCLSDDNTCRSQHCGVLVLHPPCIPEQGSLIRHVSASQSRAPSLWPLRPLMMWMWQSQPGAYPASLPSSPDQAPSVAGSNPMYDPKRHRRAKTRRAKQGQAGGGRGVAGARWFPQRKNSKDGSSAIGASGVGDPRHATTTPPEAFIPMRLHTTRPSSIAFTSATSDQSKGQWGASGVTPRGTTEAPPYAYDARRGAGRRVGSQAGRGGTVPAYQRNSTSSLTQVPHRALECRSYSSASSPLVRM